MLINKVDVDVEADGSKSVKHRQKAAFLNFVFEFAVGNPEHDAVSVLLKIAHVRPYPAIVLLLSVDRIDQVKMPFEYRGERLSFIGLPKPYCFAEIVRSYGAANFFAVGSRWSSAWDRLTK